MKQSKDGLFGVWLCDHYVWRCFIIDDRIPVDGNGRPYHMISKCNSFNYVENWEKQAWPYLLQKALAVCLGGY